MKLRVMFRLGWIGLFAILCGVALTFSITRGQMPLSAAGFGATPGVGVHLGNVSIDAWRDSYFSLIDGEGGKWPAVVVVMSDQVYKIDREPPDSCRITGVQVPGDPSPQRVWSYLQKASAAGKRIVIRIYPSPGYFDDGYHLVPTYPVEDYCHWDVRRGVDDIGQEICEIHKFNQGKLKSWVGFLPANEPNLEWYTRPEPTPQPPIRPENDAAWEDMDRYFTAIYEYVKGNCPTAQVLTPPMSQNQYAEGWAVNHNRCDPQRPLPSNQPGYELMKNVFGEGSKNDGYTWNNYWARDGERWSHCDADPIPKPYGQHVAIYFPTPMQARIVAKGGLITEADLASPLQGFGNPLKDKDEREGQEAACSLKAFYDAEELADYAAAWNLNVSIGDEEMN